MKSIINVIKENKGAIAKKALIGAGVVAGLFIGLKALTGKGKDELEDDFVDDDDSEEVDSEVENQ